MDKFASALERTIVVLKDNSLHTNLGGRTLYGIMVEKLPENLLKDYYSWFKEQRQNETMETLNEWVAVEADLQTQASEVKHGFTRKYEGQQVVVTRREKHQIVRHEFTRRQDRKRN